MPQPFGSYPFNAAGVDNFVYPPFLNPNLRAPTINDIQNPGTRWLDDSVNPPVIYETTGAGNWIPLQSIASLTALFAAPPPIGSTTPNTGAFTQLTTTPSNLTAGASPQTANNRTGRVIFSGASIAAGATQSFVISNSFATVSTQVCDVSLIGGTTGAALSIQSVTVGSGTITIVVQNGTGATTSTANLTFVFWLMN